MVPAIPQFIPCVKLAIYSDKLLGTESYREIDLAIGHLLGYVLELVFGEGTASEWIIMIISYD